MRSLVSLLRNPLLQPSTIGSSTANVFQVTSNAEQSSLSCVASKASGLLSRSQPSSFPNSIHQVRHARLIRRPRRPYSFTQLVQLSDGSAFFTRTTSPQAIYRSTKDSRNHNLWQPSDKSLRNVEVDEAGKLAAFRERFGRGFDLSLSQSEDGQVQEETSATNSSNESQATTSTSEDLSSMGDLGDLIRGYSDRNPEKTAVAPTMKTVSKGKGKK